MHCNICVNLAHTFRRDIKPLNRLIDKLLLLLCAVKNEENIAVFLSLIPYSCIPDPLLCPVGY